MKYNIYANGKKINAIISDEEFCKKYCEKNSYTYELVENIEASPKAEETIIEAEQLRADIDYIAIMAEVEL